MRSLPWRQCPLDIVVRSSNVEFAVIVGGDAMYEQWVSVGDQRAHVAGWNAREAADLRRALLLTQNPSTHAR